MVDVTPKEPTHRRAIARGRVYMQPETASLVARGAISKGDVLAVARVAGIQAAKRTPDLIPLCHPLLVGSVLASALLSARLAEHVPGPSADTGLRSLLPRGALVLIALLDEQPPRLVLRHAAPMQPDGGQEAAVA